MMTSSGQDLLSARASAIWIAALCAVLVFHCAHLIQMRGERRWYHSAHVVMLLGMLYMYASVAFGLDWFPARVWMIVYVATSVAIIGWMLVQFGLRRSFAYLWILALVQQGAMIYMWAPMTDWVPRLSYAFVVYFALEAIAWLTRAHSTAFAGTGGAVAIPLAERSALGDICMTIMAGSMGYMFAGMQLMMSMPRQSQQLAQLQQQQPAQESVSSPGRDQSRLRTPAKAPKVAANEPAKEAAETSPPALAESYTIVAGDSLRRIAARLYGDARRWRGIMKANPGLHPRRLRIGQVLKLPMTVSPGERGAVRGSIRGRH
ncbi:MAG: LysM peptidoglycan-binding domain-containing protein [Methylocella sp.]